jgi:hypothetical protein
LAYQPSIAQEPAPGQFKTVVFTAPALTCKYAYIDKYIYIYIYIHGERGGERVCIYIYIYRERERGREREGEREREREANNPTRVYVCMCVYYIWSKRHHTKINPPQG